MTLRQLSRFLVAWIPVIVLISFITVPVKDWWVETRLLVTFITLQILYVLILDLTKSRKVRHEKETSHE